MLYFGLKHEYYQTFSPENLLPVDTVNLLAALFLKFGTLSGDSKALGSYLMVSVGLRSVGRVGVGAGGLLVNLLQSRMVLSCWLRAWRSWELKQAVLSLSWQWESPASLALRQLSTMLSEFRFVRFWQSRRGRWASIISNSLLTSGAFLAGDSSAKEQSRLLYLEGEVGLGGSACAICSRFSRLINLSFQRSNYASFISCCCSSCFRYSSIRTRCLSASILALSQAWRLTSASLISHSFLFSSMLIRSHWMSYSSACLSAAQASLIFSARSLNCPLRVEMVSFQRVGLLLWSSSVYFLWGGFSFLLEALILARQALFLVSSPSSTQASCCCEILPSRLQLTASISFSTCRRPTSYPQFLRNLKRSYAHTQQWSLPSMATRAPLLEQSSLLTSCRLSSMIRISRFITSSSIRRKMSNCCRRVSCWAQEISGFSTRSATSWRRARSSLGRRKTANSRRLISPTFMLSNQLKAQVSSFLWEVPTTRWKSFSRRYPFSSRSRNRKSAMQSKKGMRASASRYDYNAYDSSTTSARMLPRTVRDFIESMSCWQYAILSLLRSIYCYYQGRLLKFIDCLLSAFICTFIDWLPSYRLERWQVCV